MNDSHSKFYAFEFVPSAKKEWKRASYALIQWQRWKNIGVNLPLSGEQETSLTNPSDEAKMNSISIALQAASMSPNYTQSYPGKSEVTLLRLPFGLYSVTLWTRNPGPREETHFSATAIPSTLGSCSTLLLTHVKKIERWVTGGGMTCNVVVAFLIVCISVYVSVPDTSWTKLPTC